MSGDSGDTGFGGSKRSGSSYVEFESRGATLHPAYRANSDILLRWAKEVYMQGEGVANLATMDDLTRAWARQVHRVRLSARPWSMVAGPAGAVTATLRRIGWRAISASKWMDADRAILDLCNRG